MLRDEASSGLFLNLKRPPFGGLFSSLEQIERVERGEDPMAVFRDPVRNRMIEVPREESPHYVARNFIAEGSDLTTAIRKQIVAANE